MHTRFFIPTVPLLALAFSCAAPGAQAQQKKEVDGYHEFNYGKVQEGAENWTEVIQVLEPAPRSEVQGDVKVSFKAPGMNWATAWCWQQPDNPRSVPPAAWGKDVELTPNGMKLGADGSGSFVFPANKFPNGPVNVRIHARNDEGKKDIYELQLFNSGGVAWNQGIPKTNPPGAKGLKLIFADDFNGPLSITSDGRGARYSSHKPGGGDFSGWQFSDVLGPGKPFSQQGTWLRIAGRKDDESPKGRSGLIASVDQDFKGVWAKAPCYLECRFTAQSAIGTWPAFWTLAFQGKGVTDELDIIEAYGGRGKGNPNHPGYSLVTHYWGQKNPDGSDRKADSARPPIMELGGKSYWSTTFHTYAVYVGLEETIYYFDDMEVHCHPTNSVSRDNPHLFLVNLAIGGISGWPINLSRYGEGTDMWVDYIRVYAKDPVPENYRPNFDPQPDIASAGIGLNFSVSGVAATELDARSTAGAKGVMQRNWNNLESESGTESRVTDSNGKSPVGFNAKWSATGQDGKTIEGRGWGFEHSNLKLQRGLILDGGNLDITGIPYKRYDVYVYFGADEHGGAGSASISASNGTVDPNATYYYKVGWMKGEFIPSEATTLESVKDSNCVIFKNNTARDIQLEWAGNLEGAKTGVTGIQIVERK
jgi:hypothetical protein